MRTASEHARYVHLCEHDANLNVPDAAVDAASAIEGDWSNMPRLHTVARLHLSDLSHRVTRATLRQRRYDLEAFVAHIGGDVRVRAIKKKHIESWVRTQTCAPATLRLRFLSVRMLFKFAFERGWVKTAPTMGIVLPRVPRRLSRALSLADLQSLGRVLPDERAQVIVALALNEGLRRVEIARLELGDIDFPSMTMRVVTAKSGGVEDVLPLTEATWVDFLRPYLAVRGNHPGPLIVSYTTGGGLSPARIGSMVSRWMREAGIKGAAFDGKSLHAMRHTTAANLLAQGADPTIVQRALRHATLSSTWTYLRNQRSVEELRPLMGQQMKEAG